METIVFVHGLGSSHRVWRSQTTALSDRYHVITVDLPGHGDAPGPFTLGQAVQAIKDQLTDRCHLVAIGAGGTIALLTAMGEERLASLMVSEVEARPSLARRLQRSLTAALPHRLIQVWLTLGQFALNQADRRLVNEDVRRCSRKDLRTAIVKLSHTDLEPRLEQVKTSTLVLVGSREQSKLASATRVAGQLPHATLRVVPDTGPYWNLEHPDTFNRAITEFVETHAN